MSRRRENESINLDARKSIQYIQLRISERNRSTDSLKLNLISPNSTENGSSENDHIQIQICIVRRVKPFLLMNETLYSIQLCNLKEKFYRSYKSQLYFIWDYLNEKQKERERANIFLTILIQLDLINNTFYYIEMILSELVKC